MFVGSFFTRSLKLRDVHCCTHSHISQLHHICPVSSFFISSSYLPSPFSPLPLFPLLIFALPLSLPPLFSYPPRLFSLPLSPLFFYPFLSFIPPTCINISLFSFFLFSLLFQLTLLSPFTPSFLFSSSYLLASPFPPSSQCLSLLSPLLFLFYPLRLPLPSPIFPVASFWLSYVSIVRSMVVPLSHHFSCPVT